VEKKHHFIRKHDLSDEGNWSIYKLSNNELWFPVAVTCCMSHSDFGR